MVFTSRVDDRYPTLPPDVNQLGLFETSHDGIEAAFWKFHEANPQVYRLLVQYARQAKAAGRRRFGIGMLWERLRWYTQVETSDSTRLKLNNNYRSRFARLLMARERCTETCEGCDAPGCLADLFDLRELQQPSAAEVA